MKMWQAIDSIVRAFTRRHPLYGLASLAIIMTALVAVVAFGGANFFGIAR